MAASANGVDPGPLDTRPDDGRSGSDLQVEHPLARLALGGRGEGVDVLEPVPLGHDGTGRGPPVEFTVSTVGPDSP